MNILIVGDKGNMGRRYKLIAESMLHNVTGIDVDNIDKLDETAKTVDRIIIATPTETHLELIQRLSIHNKRILCEKPICRSSEQLRKVLKSVHEKTLWMVYNYNYCTNLSISYSMSRECHFTLQEKKRSDGLTWYKYYSSGNDGLGWDCIQLIKLAQRRIEISNNSAEWDCGINGYKIDRNCIDMSYRMMLNDFLHNDNYQKKEEIISAHEKVEKIYAESQSNNNGRHRHTSENYKCEIPQQNT